MEQYLGYKHDPSSPIFVFSLNVQSKYTSYLQYSWKVYTYVFFPQYLRFLFFFFFVFGSLNTFVPFPADLQTPLTLSWSDADSLFKA